MQQIKYKSDSSKLSFRVLININQETLDNQHQIAQKL